MNALNVIATKRPPSFGGGLLPIPFDAILDYAAYLGMTQREADNLFRIIRNVDAYRCNKVAEKAKKKAAKTAK